MIKANIEFPPGVLIFEDPPTHTTHRKLLSGVFTPRKVTALEPKIREFCARCLKPLVGAGRFNFVANIGALVPMWDDRHAVRHPGAGPGVHQGPR